MVFSLAFKNCSRGLVLPSEGEGPNKLKHIKKITGLWLAEPLLSKGGFSRKTAKGS